MKKIKLTLDHIERDQAVLYGPDHSQIQIPKALIPESKKGSILSIEIKNEEEAKSSDEKLAKAILNEILKVSED